MARVSKYTYQTERLQECDMPHSQSVRLCLLDSEFSMSAKAFGKKGESGGLSDKKAYLQILHQTPHSLELRLNTYLLY